MNGFIIYYKPFDTLCRVNLHHTLFGRILYRNNRGNKYVFYIQGMLDNTPFVRLADRKIFVIDMQDINLEELRIFAEISITECDQDISDDMFKTGQEYWEEKATSKELPIRIRRRKKWKQELKY